MSTFVDSFVSQTIYLGSFINLSRLNASHNPLPNFLHGTKNGIERCTRIMYLSLAHCGISDPTHLAELANFPFLIELDMRGNPVSVAESYRNKVLFLTRNARGALWRRGLLKLDGTAVAEKEVSFAVGVREGRQSGLSFHWQLAVEVRCL